MNDASEMSASWHTGESRRYRRRRRRRARTAEPRDARRTPRGLLETCTAWLSGLEEALTRVERAAREARSLSHSAGQLWQRSAADQPDLSVSLKARASRLHKTGGMLAQLVIAYRLFGLRTALLSRQRAHELLQALHAEQAARFRDVSHAQGGAFLKVGQLLSARRDLLPALWVDALSTLQDAAPPIPEYELSALLRRELGAENKQLAHFELQPLAAASIGQVHRARTHSGLEVAVKVRRPGIAVRVDDDLALLSLALQALSDQLPALDWNSIEQEIQSHIRAELDYEREASLSARAAAFFRGSPDVIVPEVVADLCSCELLTTCFVQGPKITTLLDELSLARAAGDAQAHARISEILGRLLSAYLRQIFELGMFQADPHPGNLLVGEADRVVILDFGCAAELSETLRLAYLRLVNAFFAGDKSSMVDALGTLGFRTRSGKPDTMLSFMEALLGELATAVQTGHVHWPEREELLARVRALGDALAADPVTQIPGHFVMIGRVLATLSGLFAHYKPDIDVVRFVLPVVMPQNVLRA